MQQETQKQIDPERIKQPAEARTTEELLVFARKEGLLLPLHRISFQNHSKEYSFDLTSNKQRGEIIKGHITTTKANELSVSLTGPSSWQDKLVAIGWTTFQDFDEKYQDGPIDQKLFFAIPTLTQSEDMQYFVAGWYLENSSNSAELDLGIKYWGWSHLEGKAVADALYQSISRRNFKEWHEFLQKQEKVLSLQARLAIEFALQDITTHKP